ncbi:MAG: P-II family nitrogen regulator [Myxococcales bacterium]|nr:P-II family nitrogen regulator [Myxococcales bacterium]
MKRVEAIIQPSRLDDVVERLQMIGVNGMTISEVKGFGRTGGRTEVYRGSAYAIDLLPKVRLQCVVPDDRVEQTVAAIVIRARTENIGDGKIFVLPVDEAIRIRTGETGDDAL